MAESQESFLESDEEPVKKTTRKRRISSDDEDWVPDQPSKIKKNVNGEKPAPKRTKNSNAGVQKETKVKVKKEPKVRVKKEPKVKTEPQVKIKKERTTRIKKEPVIQIKQEPGIKSEINSDTENFFRIKSEPLDENDQAEVTENLFNVKSEPDDKNYKNDFAASYKDKKPYEAPGSQWEPSELLREMLMLDHSTANNIVRLFENENTIPFIARYRKELTGNMDAETLRSAKDAYDTIKGIQAKQISILKTLDKSGILSPLLEQWILGARSFSELEHIYAPYKVGSKRTKAEAARKIGLELPAMALLYGTELVRLEPFIDHDIDGLSIISDIENGVSHIIADVISKDKNVLDTLRKLQKETRMRIETTKSKSASQAEKTTPKKDKDNTKKKNEKSNQNKDVEEKYQNYYQFNCPLAHIKPHQVLAINRGENQKILSVKVIIPDWMMNRLHGFCRSHFLNSGMRYQLRQDIFEKSFKDSYTRLIQPLVIRSVRAELNKSAERASIEVFAMNLKKLLLTPPLRCKVVMGIDPGFSHGCKVAVTAPNGDVLDTTVLHIKFTNHVNPTFDRSASILREMLIKHNCETIGLGNGTACRQTETYLSQLIKMKWFDPLDVQFTIITESGASIYSCSPEATKEFPDMDPNLISAVSLARRLQDPLGEFVKVEPKHLGVGMYQHDVSEKQLSSTLDEVVSECVSFVGVDINTASHCILRRVAGLNTTRASKIIDWRTTSGPFTNRRQLLLVKGIGEKSFEQCAGFVRILPQTFNSIKTELDSGPSASKGAKKRKTLVETDVNPLDRTWIHPEMYTTANRFIGRCGAQLNQLGTWDFIRSVSNYVSNTGIQELAEELGISEAQVKFINEGLTQPPDYDMRAQFSKPLFRKSFASFEDLQIGSILTGRVENVTHFGCFVDVGVGKSGLLPMRRLKVVPQLGDRVEVKVFDVELQRKRITLDLIRML